MQKNKVANSSLQHVRQTECCYEASHFALHNVAIAVHLLKEGYKNLWLKKGGHYRYFPMEFNCGIVLTVATSTCMYTGHNYSFNVFLHTVEVHKNGL